jgi:DNA-directed RNA polymerase specialized sigma24 family protein
MGTVLTGRRAAVGRDDLWDDAGLEQLRNLYEPSRRFAAVIGRWDVDPDDLVQDAFAKVLTLDPSGIRDLGPYVRRIIANLANDQRRRAGRTQTVLHRLGDSTTTSDSYPSDLDDLMRLQPQVRALLYLVEVEGAQIAEAAEVVGMAGSTARVALMRARRRLRSELNVEASGE